MKFAGKGHLKQLKDQEGFDSKEKLIDWIYKNTSVTAGDYWENAAKLSSCSERCVR